MKEDKTNSDISEKYVEGFNLAYELSKVNRELAAKLFGKTDQDSDLVQGYKDGQAQFELETNKNLDKNRLVDRDDHETPDTEWNINPTEMGRSLDPKEPTIDKDREI